MDHHHDAFALQVLQLINQRARAHQSRFMIATTSPLRGRLTRSLLFILINSASYAAAPVRREHQLVVFDPWIFALLSY